ncbi:hypothetical protein AB0M44_16500 [Streptosporangium subroseum]|uniref:hypothetical protein n=1 Tax=Streptosporangium subroseum TaxID=106412 RepID=UPI003437328F
MINRVFGRPVDHSWPAIHRANAERRLLRAAGDVTERAGAPSRAWLTRARLKAWWNANGKNARDDCAA